MSKKRAVMLFNTHSQHLEGKKNKKIGGRVEKKKNGRKYKQKMKEIKGGESLSLSVGDVVCCVISVLWLKDAVYWFRVLYIEYIYYI
jgi:hypothetical protein